MNKNEIKTKFMATVSFAEAMEVAEDVTAQGGNRTFRASNCWGPGGQVVKNLHPLAALVRANRDEPNRFVSCDCSDEELEQWGTIAKFLTWRRSFSTAKEFLSRFG